MPYSASTKASSLTLDEVVSRLTLHGTVDGIMLLGSTGTDDLTPTSDYDLLLVLNALPAPIRMVNTWVDSRLTEVYCTTIAALERIVAERATWPDGSEEGTLLVWLKEGQLVWDRSARVAAIRERATAAPVPTLADDHTIHEAWRKIGYNVQQVKRYLHADDPVSAAIIEMRLLYSVAEVNFHYFTVRRLPWHGEKPAIRYWLGHDPDYLACFQRYIAERDLERKVALYEELADLALAPLGGVWKRGETVVSIGAGYGTGITDLADGAEQDALAFWQELIGESDNAKS